MLAPCGKTPAEMGAVLSFGTIVPSQVTHCYVSDAVYVVKQMRRSIAERDYPELGPATLDMDHQLGVWAYDAELIAVWETGTCRYCWAMVFRLDLASRRTLNMIAIGGLDEH